MPSNQQDVGQPTVSPVLFLTVDGEPLTFFLRPGPVKRKLQPLIRAGGGVMCNVQQPGAILLVDPEEWSSVSESTARRYVSTLYIQDCVEKGEQLNLEDYKLNSEVGQRHSARLNSSKDSSPGLLGGRSHYTSEEDAAILNYVSKHKKEVGGNRLWQEMEKQRVTSHSWQSMKYRYKVRLAKKQSDVAEVETAEEDNKAAEETTEVEGNEEADVQKPSCGEDVAPPQTHSAETDLTQIDEQSVLAGSTPEDADVEAQASILLQEEGQHVNQQTDEQPAESTQSETAEGETSHSPQAEGPCVDLQTDTQLLTAETSEPDRDEPPIKKESLPEGSTPAPPESPPKTTSSKKPKEKQKAAAEPEQPQRRVTRRQLEFEASSALQPYNKKLRSSPTHAEQPTSSLKPSKKPKSAVKPALQKDTMADQPPPKRARGKSVEAPVESQQEQSEQATLSKTAKADESKSVPRKAVKRPLGILELAAKEFDSDSDSPCDEDEAPELQNPAETAATSTEPLPPPSDTAASDPDSPQSNPDPGPSLQENMQEAQASGSSCVPETGCPEPAAAEPAVSKAVNGTSKPHLFIFDRESQEEESQSVLVSDRPAASSNPQATVNNAAALSLTQVQLEEDKQRIRELMKQTGQDIVSVTKALLKTSGEFSAALNLLMNPSSVSGPFWNSNDDSLLLSADPAVRQQLQEKYSEVAVAKRIFFLELEGEK